MNPADERRFYDYAGSETDYDVDCNLLDNFDDCWDAYPFLLDDLMGYAVMNAYVSSMGCLDSGMT